MERKHSVDEGDATGKLVSECYCPRCDQYSGGGMCRVCRREVAVEEQNATSGDDSSTTRDSTRQQSLL